MSQRKIVIKRLNTKPPKGLKTSLQLSDLHQTLTDCFLLLHERLNAIEEMTQAIQTTFVDIDPLTKSSEEVRLLLLDTEKAMMDTMGILLREGIYVHSDTEDIT